MPDGASYDSDFFLWAREQADRLRQAGAGGSNHALDYENLAEEIEGLSKRDQRALRSHLVIILEHMVKLRCSKAVEPRMGWESTIVRARDDAEAILEDSTTLRQMLPDLTKAAYNLARKYASRELLQYGEDGEAVLAKLIDGQALRERVLEDGYFPAHED